MEITQNKYSLPIKKKDFRFAFSDSQAHYGLLENAVDFPLHIGTEILAAKEGKVIAVKTDSNEGGLDEKYSQEPNKYLNSISIEHEKGKISEYAHLKHNGATVEKGQYVNEGDLIGYSGNTGFSSAPHLHFHVARIDKNFEAGFKTLKVNFKEPIKINRSIEDLTEEQKEFFESLSN